MTSLCIPSSGSSSGSPVISLASISLLQRQRARALDKSNIIQHLSDAELDRHYEPIRSCYGVVSSSSSSSEELWRKNPSAFSGAAAVLWDAQQQEHCCSSTVIQMMRAPVSAVWSVVRRFDKPQAYKCFIRSCSVTSGDGMKVGSTREVEVVSGLPATSSKERLEILDEERHVFSFKIIGGQHRLKNYCSVTTLHECEVDGQPGTIVLESYTVNVPEGNTTEDTRTFIDTIIKCNLQSLARVSQLRARLINTDKTNE